ncbi:uncharacterized protein FIBRA_08406 [Fibroporia radiculosa]|uniref:C2H2-type domain-containing protein n=1 Tax=Fibroporia radiculosa TaxID=599839 RepID=J4ICC4_9APHY|nr:uncharacterized protein FIBRA_08406 [Fibroporia radiculosa]CCM06166.1 predicted protein [Fibroporia radiculosa]
MLVAYKASIHSTQQSLVPIKDLPPPLSLRCLASRHDIVFPYIRHHQHDFVEKRGGSTWQRLYEKSAPTYPSFLNEINGVPGINMTRLNDNVGASYDEHPYTFDPPHLGARRSVHVSSRPSVDISQDQFPGYRLVSLQDATTLVASGVPILCLVGRGADSPQPNMTEPVPYASEWSTPLVPAALPSNVIHAPPLAADGVISVASIQSLVYPPVVDTSRTTHVMGSETSMTTSQGPTPIPQTGPLDRFVDAHAENVVAAASNTMEMLGRGVLASTHHHGHSGICGSSLSGHAVDTLEPAHRLQNPQSRGEHVPATKTCGWAGCDAQLDDPSASSIRRHFEEHHAADYHTNNEDRDARQRLVCRWGQCKTKVKKGNLYKHIRTVHLRMMETTCKCCGRVFSRQDALIRHQAKFGH